MNLASRALRQALFVAALASGLAAGAAFAANSYAVRNLVSDGGVPAEHRDDNLKNGWGSALSATSPSGVRQRHLHAPQENARRVRRSEYPRQLLAVQHFGPRRAPLRRVCTKERGRQRRGR